MASTAIAGKYIQMFASVTYIMYSHTVQLQPYIYIDIYIYQIDFTSHCLFNSEN